MSAGQEAILKALRDAGVLRDGPTDKPDSRVDRVSFRSMPAIAPTFADSQLADRLQPRLLKNLDAMGILSLYRHQREAIEFALSGEDMVLECPTASGKTLCFDIPVIQRLAQSNDGHALMLFPMKALARDQVRQFNELANGMTHQKGKRIEVWTYDGDTDGDTRGVMRRDPPSVLVTNPEMLHQSMLGARDSWNDRFLRKLQAVVIDEVHEYRGYFGTQVSLVLRRFFAYLESIGVHPQVILATATCANPEEHAKRLTGRDCKLFRATDAWAPQRDFTFIQPLSIPEHDFAGLFRHRIASAAYELEKLGLSTIVFCPSRNFVEDVTKRCHRLAEKEGRDRSGRASYRAGYSAEDRSAIEQDLRDGSIKVVFTTSALEIGIDVGKLDACILAGFPDSTMSAWQRIGRVGRASGKTAHVIYFAADNAFDQFYAENLPTFLDRHLDEIFIGTDNEELMQQHLPYLLAEVGRERNAAVDDALGKPLSTFASEKVQGTSAAAGARPYYPKLLIRGASGAILKLMTGGKEIGTISEEQQFREAYEGAIYHHQGTYKVVAVGGGEVQLESAAPHLRTKPRFYTTMSVRESLRGLKFSGLSQWYGKVDFYRNFTGFDLVNDHTEERIESVTANQTRRLSVRATWFEFESSGFGGGRAASIEHLRAFEQLLRIGALFAVPCDRHDIGTFVDPTTRRVYFHETVPGGVGIADRAYEVWTRIVDRGMSVAKACACEDGCPRCIHPPRYKPADGLISKTSALVFGQRLQEIAKVGPTDEFDSAVNGWRPRP